jgi:hypothetical protein
VEGICQALANKIVQVLPKVSNKNENVVFKCFGLIEMLFTHTKDQLNRENLGDSLEKSLVPLLGILSGTKLNPFDSELVSLLQLIISTRESRLESQQKSPPSLSSSPSKLCSPGSSTTTALSASSNLPTVCSSTPETSWCTTWTSWISYKPLNKLLINLNSENLVSDSVKLLLVAAIIEVHRHLR